MSERESFDLKSFVYKLVLPIYLWSIGYKTLDEYLTEVEKQNSFTVEQDTKNKLLATINSFLAESGIKDTDGTPLTFSPERFYDGK